MPEHRCPGREEKVLVRVIPEGIELQFFPERALAAPDRA